MPSHARSLLLGLVALATGLGGCLVGGRGYYYPTAAYDVNYGYVAQPVQGRVYYGGGYYSGVYYRPGYYAPNAPFVAMRAAPATYYGQPGYVQPGYVQPGYVQPGYVRPGYGYGGGAVATPAAPVYGGGGGYYGGGAVAAPARPTQQYMAPAMAAPAGGGGMYVAPAGGGVQVAPRVGVPVR